jgi:hypothetical protein
MKMARFSVHELRTIENSPSSPASLRSKIGEMILNSTIARARVEALNPDTGEYRVVLQGTLDREESRLEEK